MGYQIVDIVLNSGKKLNRRKVMYSTFLILEEDENFKNEDIDSIRISE